MSEVIKVGMADLNICKNPDIITTWVLVLVLELHCMILLPK